MHELVPIVAVLLLGLTDNPTSSRSAGTAGRSAVRTHGGRGRPPKRSHVRTGRVCGFMFCSTIHDCAGRWSRADEANRRTHGGE